MKGIGAHAGQARRPWDPHEGEGEGGEEATATYWTSVLASGVLKPLPRQRAPGQGYVSILQLGSVRGPLTAPQLRLGPAGLSRSCRDSLRGSLPALKSSGQTQGERSCPLLPPSTRLSPPQGIAGQASGRPHSDTWPGPHTPPNSRLSRTTQLAAPGYVSPSLSRSLPSSWQPAGHPACQVAAYTESQWPEGQTLWTLGM